ncbi:hypothetical protein EDB84DRAFT_1573220 [Lactarius hengduanensis]|nr:hypothetical protein EDB84DRAFT_1573220 [Lactarius hengduanensis]
MEALRRQPQATTTRRQQQQDGVEDDNDHGKTVSTLLPVLGPTLLPLTPTTGIVEQSMWRIDDVPPNGDDEESNDGDAGKDLGSDDQEGHNDQDEEEDPFAGLDQGAHAALMDNTAAVRTTLDKIRKLSFAIVHSTTIALPACEYCIAIDNITANKSVKLRKYELEDEDWDIVHDLLRVLKIYKDATLFSL